jgi:hypothetical protein
MEPDEVRTGGNRPSGGHFLESRRGLCPRPRTDASRARPTAGSLFGSVQPKNGGFPVTFFVLLPLQQLGGGEISNLSPALIVLLSETEKKKIRLIRLHSSSVHPSSLLAFT